MTSVRPLRCVGCHGRLASVNMLSSDCTGPGSPVTSLYLTASILLLVSLCIPWTHSPTASASARCVWARFLLSLSHLALAAWAFSDLCSVPLFCWHSLLFLVSLAKFSEVRSLCSPMHSSHFDKLLSGTVALLAFLFTLLD